MNKYIIFLLFILLQNIVFGQFQMRERTSISVVILNNGKQTDQQFRQTCERIKNIYFNADNVKKYDINYIQANLDIPEDKMADATLATDFINKSDIGRKVMSYFWARDSIGRFHLDTIAVRGKKSASYLDSIMSQKSSRGEALMKDAGRFLIDDAHVLVLNVTNLQTKTQTYNELDSIANKLGLPKVSRGFIGYDVSVEGYLFRLVYDDSVKNILYNKMWIYDTDSPDAIATKKQLFDNYPFKLSFVRTVKKQALDINKTALAAIISNSRKSKKLQRFIIENLGLTVDPIHDNPMFSKTISFPLPKQALIARRITINVVETNNKNIKLKLNLPAIKDQLLHRFVVWDFFPPKGYKFKFKYLLKRSKRQEVLSFVDWNPRFFFNTIRPWNFLLLFPMDYKFHLEDIFSRVKRQEMISYIEFPYSRNALGGKGYLINQDSVPTDIAGIPFILQIPKSSVYDLSAYAVMNVIYHNLPNNIADRVIYSTHPIKIEIGTKEGIQSGQFFDVYEKRFRYNNTKNGKPNPIVGKRIARLQAGSRITYNEGMVVGDSSIKLTRFQRISGTKPIQEGMWVKPAPKDLGIGISLMGLLYPDFIALFVDNNYNFNKILLGLSGAGIGTEINITRLLSRFTPKGFPTGLKIGTNFNYIAGYQFLDTINMEGRIIGCPSWNFCLKKDWYIGSNNTMRIGTYLGLGSIKAKFTTNDIYPTTDIYRTTTMPWGIEAGFPIFAPNVNFFFNYENAFWLNIKHQKEDGEWETLGDFRQTNVGFRIRMIRLGARISF